MRIDFFAKCLAESLVERGVPEKAAFYHVDVLVRTFSEEDLKEVDSYSSPDDFKALSDSLAVMITEKEQHRSAKRDAPDLQFLQLLRMIPMLRMSSAKPELSMLKRPQTKITAAY